MLMQLMHISAELSITIQPESGIDTILGANTSPVYSVTTQSVPVEIITFCFYKPVVPVVLPVVPVVPVVAVVPVVLNSLYMQ
jgi:hypothetical protein